MRAAIQEKLTAILRSGSISQPLESLSPETLAAGEPGWMLENQAPTRVLLSAEGWGPGVPGSTSTHDRRERFGSPALTRRASVP